MEAAREQMSQFTDELYVRFGTDASHRWSVDHGNCTCGANVADFATMCGNAENCDYDLTGDMFRAFFPSVSPRVATREQGLYWLDQWHYYALADAPTAFSSPMSSDLLRFAPVYVPAACEGQTSFCRLHVNYHGCTEKPDEDTFDGWNERLAWGRYIDINACTPYRPRTVGPRAGC